MVAMVSYFIKRYEQLLNRVRPVKAAFYPSTRELASIQKFLGKYPSATESFIDDYLAFQVSVYANKETKFGVGNIQLNWVIGPKAEARWNKKADGAYHVIGELKKKFGVKSKPQSSDWQLSTEYEDRQRQLTQLTEANLFSCIDLELYRPNNPICSTCKHKSKCK